MCALEGLNAWHVVLINSFLFTLSLFSVFVCLCLWFPLTVSLFLSSHSHPLSVSLLFFCTVSTSASVSCSRRSSTRPNTSITCFPILRTLLLLPLQLDELFSKINPWQATKCNYTSTSISFPLSIFLCPSPSTLGHSQPPLHINYCQQAANCSQQLLPPSTSNPNPSSQCHSQSQNCAHPPGQSPCGVQLSVGVRLLLNSFDFRAF